VGKYYHIVFGILQSLLLAHFLYGLRTFYIPKEHGQAFFHGKKTLIYIFSISHFYIFIINSLIAMFTKCLLGDIYDLVSLIFSKLLFIFSFKHISYTYCKIS
jgi:hypothetical protein